MFCGTPSCGKMDSGGEVHRIPQGEGGEQGDLVMPLLYCLGQHGALEAANTSFTRGERLLAFLDDTFIVTPTAVEVGPAYGHVQNALRNHSGREDQDLESRREPTRSPTSWRGLHGRSIHEPRCGGGPTHSGKRHQGVGHALGDDMWKQ